MQPLGVVVESQELRNAGLKVTLPRLKILELLERSQQRHVSAEDVYRMLLSDGEEIGLATIYRVLTQFETAGLVTRHHFDSGQAVFELADGEHHDHIVCVKCGKVQEFFDETIESRQHDIASQSGLKLIDHSMVLYGECDPPCSKGQR